MRLIEDLLEVLVVDLIIDERDQARDAAGVGFRSGFTTAPIENRSCKTAVKCAEKTRVSPLRVVTKKESGEFRLIHHLSHPKGSSVNDGISLEEASVSYAPFDQALMLFRQAEPGAIMAKSDIASAFRLLPVQPDCYFLGFFADGKYYYDTCLPMVCSISCKYLELFSSFLKWVVKFETGSQLITHYLDNFLFVGPADSDCCERMLLKFQELMKVFGVPLSEEKTVGMLTCLSFLGIEIDSVNGVFHLPSDKIVKLLEKIDSFLSIKKSLWCRCNPFWDC
ncbi:unnamed protein product [Ranitomeya imitator]|uniref:Reverse transcriptase domain-containing protein n=1 Tax=Ranitomeya imitator TaxID=111125 RepID=A0ABN9LP73_9NEOB|nr:unnamed protein product [Ranitomeya imitator]